jgi:hypothetical protein
LRDTGYIDCIEATRQLGNARSELTLAQDNADESVVAEKRREAAARAESALQISSDMLNTLATVTRNQSDRGAIAVMSEYIYRPLQEQVRQLRK